MKVAIYCRVSTQEQKTENQSIILIDHAKKNKWNYTVFTEHQSTRKTRPVKYKLFQMLREHRFDAVCVLKLDRWGRSTQELITEITELYKKGIIFISLHDNIDLSTPTGKLQFDILSAFAEFERSLISQRTKEGLARVKYRGTRLGRPNGSKDKKKRSNKGYLRRYYEQKTTN